MGIVPDDNETRRIGTLVYERIMATSPQASMELVFFSTVDEFEKYNQDNNGTVFGGIVFTDTVTYNNYSIRLPSSFLPADTSTTSESAANPFNSMYTYLSNATLYDSSGFMLMQSTLEQTLLEKQFNTSGMTLFSPKSRETVSAVAFSLSVMTKLLPSDQPIVDIMSLLPMIIPSFFLIAFIPLVVVALTNLVGEKSSKVRDYLRMMGLKLHVYWLSWAITLIIPLLLSAFVMVILGIVSGMFKYSSWLLVLLLFLEFACSIMTFCFMAQAFLNNRSVAIVVGVVWIYLIGGLMAYIPVNRGLYAILSLIAPVDFYLGLYQIVLCEVEKTGMTFSVAQTAPPDGLSVSVLLAMIFVDTLLYMAIAWYLNEVNPGEYGVPKPYYFPFMKSYWFPTKRRPVLLDAEVEELQQPHYEDATAFETCSTHINIHQGVHLQFLTKTFPGMASADPVHAVDGITASLHPGQIFCLLGHNGAGKTTTISMLTGLLPPTSGDAIIEGLSIRSSMDLIRERIGVCPQHDLLYETLTAREHLILFGSLKGIPSSQINTAVTEMLEAVDLQTSPKQVVKTFSGGMKRKLSLAIALIGDPKVVFLDEPSSGVDTLSRSKIWKLLKTTKENKTVVLTTHSMEEADFLSDQIFIMANGKLRCGGTPQFLKQRYGIGYYLHINKTSSCVTADVMSFLSKIISEPKLCNESHSNLDILLPRAETHHFSSLFEQLEALKDGLQIESYGLSNTSLEDVFLRITSTATAPEISGESPGIQPKLGVQTPDEPEEEAPLMNEEHIDVAATMFDQLYALCKQRFLLNWRNWKQLIFAIIAPAIIVLIILIPLELTAYAMPQAKVENQEVSLSDFAPLEIPYLVYPGCNPLDVSHFINVSSAVGFDVNFTQMTDLGTLENYTMDKQGFILALLFNSFSIQNLVFNVTLMYNQSEPNSPVASLNFLSNSLASSLDLNYYVTANSYPLPSATYESTAAISSYVYFMFLLGLMVVSALGAKHLVFQRETMLRSQMYLSGLRISVYIMTNWLADILILLPGVVLVWATFWAFQVPGLTGILFIPFMLLCILFIISLVIMNHAISNLFSKSEFCLKWIVIINFCITLIPIAVISLLLIFNQTGQLGEVITEVSPYIANCLPSSAFVSGMSYLAALTNSVKKPTISDAFTWDSKFPLSLLAISLETLILATILVLFEYLSQRVNMSKKPFTRLLHENPLEDSDVHEERLRVESNQTENDIVVVNKVSKAYRTDFVVKNTSFGIAPEECFGLLGPNGAGKTTTISMITGDQPVSFGSITLQNQPVRGLKESIYAQQRLGRCLQSNAIIDYLTGREHLELFYRIRHHSTKQLREMVINKVIQELDLVEVADRIAKVYSGGNWRKLCVAIATLPGNKIIFLDEPSTGMDPVTRRALWSVVHQEREQHKRAVILTTHSMEEAENLCTKLAIIVKGELQCLGTVQHLKAKFSGGYRLSVQLAPSTPVESFTQTVENLFPGAQIVSQFLDRRTYSVGGSKFSLSRAFNELEAAKSSGVVIDYSLYQTSLEEVFLQLASKQEEDHQAV
ncbi:ATP-binding cassette sub-family A member 3 [Pelomyxa schiedti]|nr:ATP-binding cassette sub-family A member 3 [Pelomyxa schiedti]